jgi:hypothetical protein
MVFFDSGEMVGDESALLKWPEQETSFVLHAFSGMDGPSSVSGTLVAV